MESSKKHSFLMSKVSNRLTRPYTSGCTFVISSRYPFSVEGQGEMTEGKASEAVEPPRTPTRLSTAKMVKLDKTFTLSAHRPEKRYSLIVASLQREQRIQIMLKSKPVSWTFPRARQSRKHRTNSASSPCGSERSGSLADGSRRVKPTRRRATTDAEETASEVLSTDDTEKAKAASARLS